MSLSRREFVLRGLGGSASLYFGCRGARKILAAEVGAISLPDLSAKAPTSPVAIKRCVSYEPQVIRHALHAALKLIVDIKQLVGGKTVTVKMNLTGGPGKLAGLPACRTYHVHPNVVAAVCAILNDAGAKRIYLIESSYSLKSLEEVYAKAAEWDIDAIKAAGGGNVVFEDTRNLGQWKQYSRLKVPWGGLIYPAFDVNPRYEKTDVFISLAKMKDHFQAGVTMSVKNLFGMPPSSLYGSDKADENCLNNRQSVLHNGSKPVPSGVPGEVKHDCPADQFRRVPRVTADLLGARPIDLAIIDGVETNRGGEGPWVKGVEGLKPNLVMVGLNPVCTDSVCTAVMGYDPMSDHAKFPPFQGDNHLKLLAERGVGTNNPEKIEVRGVSIKDALFPFNPKKLSIPLSAQSGRRVHAVTIG